jgi:hypothetical protein
MKLYSSIGGVVGVEDAAQDNHTLMYSFELNSPKDKHRSPTA